MVKPLLAKEEAGSAVNCLRQNYSPISINVLIPDRASYIALTIQLHSYLWLIHLVEFADGHFSTSEADKMDGHSLTRPTAIHP